MESDMKIYGLEVNSRKNAFGIDGIPYFSWKMESEDKNVFQKTYRIQVENVWDSGVVESREQAFVVYGGEKLAACTSYKWKVTVCDNYGNEAEAESFFETASPAWKAKWIESSIPRGTSEYDYEKHSAENILDETKSGLKAGAPAILFERIFTIPDKKIASARVYATACGVYRFRVNEIRPDDREFAPEFTSYEKLHYYQTYDVTDYLKTGKNSLDFYVADGWYFSDQATPVLGERHQAHSVLYQLEIIFDDGTKSEIYSDGSETCAVGTVIASDLFVGEIQDRRRNFDKKQKVLVKEYGYAQLTAQPMDPVRPMKLISAVNVFQTPKGEWIVDFGQILAGRARIKVDLPVNTQVSFQYFEILDKDGNFINTMYAPQKDIVISDGKPFLHEAMFTFHGFRYIKVEGMESVRKEDFTAVLLTTEKENLGEFTSSDLQLNRLYQNIRWSQWNNMMSIPTDCPSREKAGWTGDILIYAKTALTNENVTPFLTSWLKNVRADQKDDGAVMITSPFEKLYETLVRGVCAGFGDEKPTNVAGWSDAIVWVPYEMYKVTGNCQILYENFSAMQRFCDNLIRTAHEKNGGCEAEYDYWLFNTGFHFGEWLIPSEPVGGFEICKESSPYIAPMFAYMSMKKMAEICRVTGHDAAKYDEAQKKMKEAIQNALIIPDHLPKEKMGAYVLAFAFHLVPQEKHDEYKERLLQLIRKNQFCLDTGFLATPFLLDVLCDLGEEETAEKIFWQNKCPSWFYEVENGATAIWEAWNADEAKNTGRFVSFDHYAFGIVDDWIMRRLCGIDSDTPGFSHILIAPMHDKRISWLKRSFETIHGEVKVEYKGDHLTVVIPPNCTASVLWNGRKREIGSGVYNF